MISAQILMFFCRILCRGIAQAIDINSFYTMLAQQRRRCSNGTAGGDDIIDKGDMGRQCLIGKYKCPFKVMLTLGPAEAMLGRRIALAFYSLGIKVATGMPGNDLGDKAALVETTLQAADRV